MNAKRLHYADGTPTDIYLCGKCGAYRDIGFAPIADGKGHTFTPEERLKLTEASAERCCNYKCNKCGVATKQFFNECDKCRDARWDSERIEKEAAAFAKAKERTDYAGPFMFNDRYFADMEAVLDHCECRDIEVPEYLWVPEEMVLSMDADNIIESALEEHYEGADDNIDKDARKELQNRLDAWCVKQCIRSYYECHKEYVTVPKEATVETKE
jgi:hypothetical protein